MTIAAGQTVTVGIFPVDAYGNPTTVYGITWASSDTTKVTLVPSTDGTSVAATSVGPVGESTISVSATGAADGTDPLTGSAVITVVAGEAVNLGEEIEPIVVALTPAAAPDAPAAA